MKRVFIILFLAIASLTLCLTACGGKNDTAKNKENDKEETVSIKTSDNELPLVEISG